MLFQAPFGFFLMKDGFVCRVFRLVDGAMQ